MRILVTGGNGFLGVRLCQHLSPRHEVEAPSHQELEITDAAATLSYINQTKPQAVIHCAAISSTGYAQQHPDESLAINVGGTVNLARACAQTGAKFVYMSSDQVYGGTSQTGPLTEDIPLAPNGIYGQHKLEAECQVQQLLPDAIGLRLTWMYDSPDSPLRLNQNILVNLQTARLNSTPVKACTRELRGLTDVWQVVRNIEKALALPGGIYNFGSENRLNTYETYLRFAAKTNTPAALIIADDTWQRNLSMSINKLRKFGIDFPDTI